MRHGEFEQSYPVLLAPVRTARNQAIVTRRQYIDLLIAVLRPDYDHISLLAIDILYLTLYNIGLYCLRLVSNSVKFTQQFYVNDKRYVNVHAHYMKVGNLTYCGSLCSR